MAFTFTNTAGYTTSGQSSMGVVAGISAAVAASMARAKARHQYRQMLQIDEHLLRDIGVTRNEIQQALRELDA